MSGSSVKRMIVGVCAAAAIGGTVATVGGAGSAQAVQVYQRGSVITVWLSPDETRQAAQMGIAQFLSQPVFRDRVRARVHPDSQYKPVYVPGRGTSYYTTPQKLVAETARHPGGRAGLVIYTNNPATPLTVSQYWPTH
jgi:hypothetical protein